MPDSEFDSSLKKLLPNALPDETPDAGFQDQLRARMSEESGARKFSPLPWLAAAALIAVVVGAVAMNSRETDMPRPAPVAEEGQRLTVSGALVLATDAEKNTALVRDLASMAVSARQAGERIGDATLLRVTDHALMLRDAAGEEQLVSVADFNDALLSRVGAEVVALHSLCRTGGLGETGLRSLMTAAQLGVPEAFAALESLADGDSPWKGDAREFLGAERDLQGLRSLTRRALSGEDRFRRQAIETLATLDAPLAIDCLRAVCAGDDVSLAAYAVEKLSARRSDGALSALRHAATNSPDPDVRVLAERALSQHMRSLRHATESR